MQKYKVYHQLLRCRDAKVTGHQSDPYQVKALEFSWKKKEKRRFVSLSKKVKKTDILNFILPEKSDLFSASFMISHRLYKMIKDWNLPAHKLYPCEVHFTVDDSDEKYYLLCFDKVSREQIYFRKSIFFDYQDKAYPQVKNEEEYFDSEAFLHSWGKVCLRDYIEDDIIYLAGNGFYVKEDCLQQWKEQNVVGWEEGRSRIFFYEHRAYKKEIVHEEIYQAKKD